VVAAVHRAVRGRSVLDLVPPEGIKLTPRHYATEDFEGCNNRCSFCISQAAR